MTKPATTKQRKLIGTLLDERIIPEGRVADLRQMIGTMVSTKDATAIITELFTFQPVDPSTGTTSFTPEAGYYRLGDQIVRVGHGRGGHWYANVASIPVPGTGKTWTRWPYVGRRINLSCAEPITSQQAVDYLNAQRELIGLPAMAEV